MAQSSLLSLVPLSGHKLHQWEGVKNQSKTISFTVSQSFKINLLVFAEAPENRHLVGVIFVFFNLLGEHAGGSVFALSDET